MVAPLGSLSPQVFLEKFWQKSPVVIRQAIPQFDLQFHKNELAGLACEEGVDTRIVTGDGGIVHPWQVVEGPFKPEIFSRLPQKLWTLLVREVELQVDEIWNLRQMFRFLPDWRVDDVMVSYAEEGGSVGPHIDYYDVFLLQGMGTRKWLIESQPRPNAELVPDLSLKILKDFQPDREYVLSPGDILYLPPGYAHHGVALGECMTLSVGCRAPSHREIFESLGIESPTEDESLRYQDPDLQIGDHPARIDKKAIGHIRELMRLTPAEEDEIELAFGRLVTQTRFEFDFPPVPVKIEAVSELLQSFDSIQRQKDVRLAFIYNPDEDQDLILFINGKEIILSEGVAEAVEILSRDHQIEIAELGEAVKNPEFLDLLGRLLAWEMFELS